MVVLEGELFLMSEVPLYYAALSSLGLMDYSQVDTFGCVLFSRRHGLFSSRHLWSLSLSLKNKTHFYLFAGVVVETRQEYLYLCSAWGARVRFVQDAGPGAAAAGEVHTEFR